MDGLGYYKDLLEDLFTVCDDVAISGQNKHGKVWDHLKIVQNAQISFNKNDFRTALISRILNYTYSDSGHYDSYSFLDLGNEFEKAMIQIME